MPALVAERAHHVADREGWCGEAAQLRVCHSATRTGNIGFTLQITLWLWFTVIFANFAEAMAEARGKAQALRLGARRLTFSHLSNAVGTPDYMAPEQVRGERGDARTDAPILLVVFTVLGALAVLAELAHRTLVPR